MFYKATARDTCSRVVPVTYTPPSGSWFAAGTTTAVTATATDACGNTSQCTFTVRVVDQSVWQTLLCGVDDCYRLRFPRLFHRFEPVCGPDACLRSAYPGATWKQFDDTKYNLFFGNSWQSLPSGIVGASLFTRMQPNCPGISDNDSISLGLTNCSPPGWAWGRRIGTSGGITGLLPSVWCGQRGRCDVPFSFNLAALPTVSGPAYNLLPHLNLTHRLDMFVQDDTTVDYARLRIRYCLSGPVVGGLTGSLTNATVAYAWDWRYCLMLDPGLPPGHAV